MPRTRDAPGFHAPGSPRAESSGADEEGHAFEEPGRARLAFPFRITRQFLAVRTRGGELVHFLDDSRVRDEGALGLV